MKILLMNLPRESETIDYTTREYLLTDFSRYPPLGLLAIAANVNHRHTIKVIDVIVKNLSIRDTIQFIEDYKPDVLGISVVTRRLYALSAISRAVKQALPNVKIVAGGPHVNYWSEATIKMGTLDYVLTGYGERSFPILIDAIENGGGEELLKKVPGLYYLSSEGKIRTSPAEEMPVVLDSLPFPDRRLINLEDYFSAIDKAKMTTLYSSRGCPFHCIFCDVQEKKFHFRSAKSVVDEFEEIEKLGIKEIYIVDDNFNVNRQRAIDICNEILRRKLKIRWSARARVFPFDEQMMDMLKKSGCRRLHVGIESVDQSILNYINKGQSLEQIQNFFRLCREFDIETLAYFVIGFSVETREYRERLLKEVMKLGVTYCFFNVLYPLPKTQYYQSLLDDGTFKEDYWADFVRNPRPNYSLPLPRSPQLQKELETLADECHRKFCFRPYFILREARKVAFSPRMFLMRIKLAFVLIWDTLQTRRKIRTEESIETI